MIALKIYGTVDNLPEAWDDLSHNDLFLKISFLKALEQASPTNIKNFYVLIYNDDKCVAKAVFQHIKFILDADNKDKKGVFKTIIKNVIKRVAKGDLIVLGNLMQTGQHGYFFDDNQINSADFFKQIDAITKDLNQLIYKETKKRVKAILLKDYFSDDAIHINQQFLNNSQYFKVAVQPNMLLHIPQSWESITDYENALKKKYKSRYKSALRKKQVLLKELDYNELIENQEAIYSLYKGVSNNADINSFVLPENHFLSLKRQLKEEFKVYAYFIDTKMVGFFTLIKNDRHLETYFLGYDLQLNHKHQLYLNMLYDMIKYGVENKFKTIVFARTALEIKSSVGAKPETMTMYMKHTKPFLNRILKFSIQFMSSKQHWQERHAFKD